MRGKPPKVIVTKLGVDPAGFWTARVSSGGSTLDVDRRYGSWQASVRRRGREVERRDVLPFVASALQARVRPLERKAAAS